MNKYIPNVTYKDTGSSQRGDVFSFLLSRRIIICSGAIDDELANVIIAQLLYLSVKNETEDIHFYINSPGGSIVSGLAIFDIMSHIKPDIKTICVGMAYSMGALLLLLGAKGKRIALPNSSIMIHQPLTTFGKNATLKETDLNILSKNLTQTKLKLSELISSRTNRSTEEVLLDIESDKYMTPEEALNYGIIDQISI